MQINEISRFDQLVNNGQSIIDAAMSNYSVSVKALVSEILSKIDTMPINEYRDATVWYWEANAFARFLAIKYDTTYEIAAGVLSAVSPRMPWLRNKNVAETILWEYVKYDDLSAIDAAKEIGLALSANVAMAIKIARGESISDTLTGTKRRSFYNNIVSPSTGDSVTVDTWMMNAVCNVADITKKEAEKFVRSNETALGGTGAGYFVIAESVREVAKQLGITANAVQAAYWCAVTGSVDGGRPEIN